MFSTISDFFGSIDGSLRRRAAPVAPVAPAAPALGFSRSKGTAVQYFSGHCWLEASVAQVHRNGDLTLRIACPAGPKNVRVARVKALVRAPQLSSSHLGTPSRRRAQQQPPRYSTGGSDAPPPYGTTLKVPTPHELMAPPSGKEIDPKLSLLTMLVDRSGSMAAMGPEVSGGCNAYLDQQRTLEAEDAGAKTQVTFSVFDNTCDRTRDAALLSAQPPITDAEVRPRGGTALYDSVAAVISDTVEQLRALDKAPANIAVFILTDGHENSSHTWSKDRIREQIELLESAPFGWSFYFAAANQDACTVGSSIGMSPDRCVTYGNDRESMAAAFQVSSEAYSRQRRGLSSAYTPQDRSRSMSHSRRSNLFGR